MYEAKKDNNNKMVIIMMMVAVYALWAWALSSKRYLGPCIDGKKKAWSRMQQINEIGN